MKGQLASDHKRELATKEDIQKVDFRLSETELKLTKEIKEVELKLTKEIKEVELKLTKEIESVKLQVEQAKSGTIKWVVGWMAGFIMAQTAIIIAILKFLK